MQRYDLSALPVVDQDQRLMGVISHDDILDVIEDEATEDIYRLANVSDADLYPDSSIRQQIRGRLPWLLVNSVASLFAAWVISNFNELLSQVALLPPIGHSALGCLTDLLQVVGARDDVRPPYHVTQIWYEKSDQKDEDGDYDEQLDKRKGTAPAY